MSVQLIPMKSKERKRFSPQQKIQIIREWERIGNGVKIAEKYQIHPHTLYCWKKALEKGAEIFLKGTKPKKSQKIRELEQENKDLKDALALQTRELMALKKKLNLI